MEINKNELNLMFEAVYSLAKKLQEGKGLNDTVYLIYQANGHWGFVPRLDENQKEAPELGKKGRSKTTTSLNHITYTVERSELKEEKSKQAVLANLKAEVEKLCKDNIISETVLAGYNNHKVIWCFGDKLAEKGLKV